MPTGPFGRRRPFVSDKRTILVLIGVDGSSPPNNIQLDLENTINSTINKALINAGANIKVTRDTVNLTVEDNPTQQQIDALGGRVIHVQQFDIKTELEEVSQTLVNAVHNTVVDKLTELGFNVEGTKTTVS